MGGVSGSIVKSAQQSTMVWLHVETLCVLLRPRYNQQALQTYTTLMQGCGITHQESVTLDVPRHRLRLLANPGPSCILDQTEVIWRQWKYCLKENIRGSAEFHSSFCFHDGHHSGGMLGGKYIKEIYQTQATFSEPSKHGNLYVLLISRITCATGPQYKRNHTGVVGGGGGVTRGAYVVGLG